MFINIRGKNGAWNNGKCRWLSKHFEKDYIKKRSYTTYGRISCNIILYIVVLFHFLTLDIVPCRLLVA